MTTSNDSAARKPLTGIRVLVGRARHQAGVLSTKLRKLGAQVIEIPFIEIRRPRSFWPLDSALKNLDTYDWLILTSVNGVEAMSARLEKLGIPIDQHEESSEREGHDFNRVAKDNPMKRTSAAERRLRVAAIGPATEKAIEQRGLKVDVVPKEYVAESVVRSLKNRVKGKRVLLIRAKVARDVIPRELRRAGAHVDVVEAYETVVPSTSRRRLQAALADPKRRPHVVTFTSSSTVKNFVELIGRKKLRALDGICMASIGPITSATLREFKLPVDIAAKEFTVPGLVAAIVATVQSEKRGWHHPPI
jgi:uroporphyrinogen-III synthase